ncbi:MAG: hypothetical protein V3R99_11455 [Thermoguttaceae bacterium]
MGRIGATLSGIERSLLNSLAEASAAATLSSLRMATGQKINSPRDDPSAFVRLSGFQSRLGIVQTTMTNVTAASSMITQSQSVIDSIRTELNTIRTQLLLDEDRSAPLSAADRAAAQTQIDTALDQINSLAMTNIDGRTLLDGSADFTVSALNENQVVDLIVHATSSSLVPDGSLPTQTISGQVTTGATRASLVYTGNASDQVTDTAAITLTGDLGNDSISMTQFDSLASVAIKINDLSYKTGVSATVDLVAHTLTLSSDNYGSRADVAVVVDSGAFAVTGGNGDGTANGTNASAVINGITYDGATSGAVDGSRFTVNQGGFRYEIAFFDGYTGTFDNVTVGGEALTFALTEDVSRRSTLAIQGALPGQLGGSAGRLSQLVGGGSLSLATLNGVGKNSSDAIRVVDQALADLTRIEGSVDGFYNAAISSASGLLSDLEDDLETSIDAINLVNNTEESVRLAYFQDLAANAVAGLSILSYQRSSIVLLIQKIAGLT